MKAWKQAYALTKLELRHSLATFITLFVFFTIINLFLITIFTTYMDSGFVGFDIIYLLLFLFAPGWVRTKEFQFQPICSNVYMVPFVSLCLHLPIPLDTIIKNRFLLYVIQAFPFQFLSLGSLYVFIPELQSQISPLAYIAFMIFWLCFGVYAGFVVPASDIGMEYKNVKKSLQVLYSIIFFMTVIVLLTGFHLIFKHGIVYWTLKLASAQPIVIILLSLLCAWLGILFWKREMRKKMLSIDYY